MNKRGQLIVLFSFLLVFVLFFGLIPAFAAINDITDDPNGGFAPQKFESLSNSDEFPRAEGADMEDLGINSIIATVAKSIIGVVGAAAFIMFVYGAFQMLFAQGNEEKIKKAKGTLVWSILGLVIVFLAYVLVSFVMQTIVTSTGQ
ncbi:MAG: pilin [Patescibacteria group bacterium]|jgi:uncharacterized membrane protein YwzB